MIIFLISILIFFISLTSLICLIKYHALEGWLIAQQEGGLLEATGGTPGCYDEKWLFAGPPVNKKQEIHLMLSHYPRMALRVGWLYFYKGSQFVFQVLKHRIKNGDWKLTQTLNDIDLYKLTTNTPLLLMASYEGELLSFTIPEMSLKMANGVNPAGLHITFNVKTKSIVKANHQEKDILGENGKISSLLITALAFWAHPQTHVAAEKSAREIAAKKIQALEPSNRYVLALHQGLLYYWNSPISPNHSLSTNVDRVSGIESSTTIPLPHLFDSRKMEFRYYSFLMQARGVVAKCLDKYKLDASLDLLFNNMVVHSVDHHLIHQNGSKHMWDLDGSGSLKSFWKSIMFINVWVSDVNSPMDQEKIGKLNPKKYPFYNEVYRELVKIDKELADCILASTSF